MTFNTHQFAVVHAAETIRGGIATYLREILALQIARYGAGRIAVIVPANQVEDLGEQNGVILIGVDQKRLRLGTAWAVRSEVRALLARASTEILHLHSAFAGLACRSLLSTRRSCAPRVVYCPHGWAFKRSSRSAVIAGRIERALSTYCDAIVCVSYSERDSALGVGIPESKLTVIQNGLPDKIFIEGAGELLWRQGVLRLVFAGRLDRQKGFDVLLAALTQTRREIEIHVFGESVLGEYTESSLPASVHMHGWQEFKTIEPFIASCDAVVMPSRWEGLSISALEAMRAGKPLISTRVGGILELVRDGVTGMLIPPGDEHSLAAVLESISVEQLASMGVCARQLFVNQFLIDGCEQALAELYNRLLTREPTLA